MKLGLLTVFLAIALSFATIVEASPVTWYLSGVTFDDGAMAIGSFVYDGTVNLYGSYSDASIDVIEAAGGSTYHYSGNGSPGGNVHEVTFGSVLNRSLFFDLAPGLRFAPGLASFDPYFSIEYDPLTSMHRHITAGFVTTETPVPEPSSILLLSMALFTLSLLLPRAASVDPSTTPGTM